MKNKAPLALMELLLMTLVFSLAAAICMRGFTTSRLSTKNSMATDSAAICIQNAAELVKYNEGDFPAETYYDEDWQPTDSEHASFVLSAERKESGKDLLGLTALTVSTMAGKEILSLDVAFQLPGKGGSK